jgi:hypothetical protein
VRTRGDQARSPDLLGNVTICPGQLIEELAARQNSTHHGVPALRGSAGRGELSAQATGSPGGCGRGVADPFQLLLCGGWLPEAPDTTFGSILRPVGVRGGGGGVRRLACILLATFAFVSLDSEPGPTGDLPADLVAVGLAGGGASSRRPLQVVICRPTSFPPAR